MAGRGKKFRFHGAFKRKADAKRKEKTCDCFIRKAKKLKRFLVLERL